MNVVDRQHPSAEQLSNFGLGRLDDEASAAIETHISDCALCRTVVENAPGDTLLSHLRHTAAAAPTLMYSGDAATAAPQLPPELADHTRYHIMGLLGQGGMGAIYKAQHRLMERVVALKLISPALLKRADLIERFRREVKAAARLSHPNIVRAYDADQAGEAHFLVMEFVDGLNLAEQVERHGPLGIDKACDYVCQAALGLQFAAEHGMVHRDIKPHNLMLTPDGQVKILDFGLARLLREETEEDLRAEVPAQGAASAGTLTEVGTLMGTADFIAPEQAADPRQADSRADIYSLGCTLYYLLAGTVPFPGGTALDKLAAHKQHKPAPLGKLRGAVPAALSAVIERMLAKDPSQRLQTPAEVALALRPFSAAATAQRRRVRRLARAAAALAAMVLAAAVIYVQTDNGELIIEADGDKVAVLVSAGGVKVRDEAARREYQLSIGRHRLRPGEYTLDVKELPAGVEFTTSNPFLLKRGARTVVRVTFDPKKAPGYLKDDALRWFPADTTFFIAMNMEVVPDITRLPLLLMAEAGGENTRRFLDIIGRIDRISFAHVANREQPKRARSFMRVTGRIARDRVIDHFRRLWKGTLQEKHLSGEEIVILHDTTKGGGALALIGTTDLVIANYQDPLEFDLPVLQECLDLRAGRGTNMPSAQTAMLKEFPDDAWEIAAGEVPEFFRKTYAFAFMRSIRTGYFWARGRSDVEMGFRGTFANAVDAQRFSMTLDLMKLLFTNAPLVAKDAELSAAVVKAFASIQREIKGDHLSGSVRIPSRAFTALVETIANMPLKELLETPALHPTKRPADAP